MLSPHLSYECNILNEVTIISPAYNYRNNNNNNTPTTKLSLSSNDILKAINSIHTYGFCILRNALTNTQINIIKQYNNASIQDLSMHGHTSFASNNNNNKDIVDDSYYDHRVDLCGPHIQKVSNDINNDNNNTNTSSWITNNNNLLCIIYNIMHPINKLKRLKTKEIKKEQKKDKKKQNQLEEFVLNDLNLNIHNDTMMENDIKSDNTIRLSTTFSDCPGDDFYSATNHLYDNYPYIPPHYMRLLLPTIPSTATNTTTTTTVNNNISNNNIPFGNAICAKSHHIIHKQSNRKQIFYNIIRPKNLYAGDAILIDGRIICADLPNTNVDGSIWNPMMCIDWKRNWFCDDDNNNSTNDSSPLC